jgi:ABC-type branched-subunit amino acid transport system ATPase component
MLEVAELDAYYGDSHILQGISLKVADSARVALVGRNGAGKSTLMKSIMNAGPRVSGKVQWDGAPLANMPAYKRARLGMCLVPEDRRILPHITVLENMEMAARAVPKERGARDPKEVLRSYPMLIPIEDRPGGRLSGGQQQMLAVARGLVQRPRLMLLDEPTEGLAPLIVEELARSVVQSCEEAKTALLLCEQNLWFARKCTSFVYVMESGRVVFEGTWSEFDANPDVKTKYLAV